MAECIHLIDPAAACLDCSPPAGCPPADPSLWGPWFDAGYHGTCAGCADGIAPGDRIRADGDDGYLCRDCGDDGRGTKSGGRAGEQEAKETPGQAELRRRFEEGYT